MDETFNDGLGVSSNTDFTITLSQPSNVGILNHGLDGVNALFAGGHVKWIKTITDANTSDKVLTPENIPNLNENNFLNPGNQTYD